MYKNYRAISRIHKNHVLPFRRSRYCCDKYTVETNDLLTYTQLIYWDIAKFRRIFISILCLIAAIISQLASYLNYICEGCFGALWVQNMIQYLYCEGRNNSVNTPPATGEEYFVLGLKSDTFASLAYFKGSVNCWMPFFLLRCIMSVVIPSRRDGKVLLIKVYPMHICPELSVKGWIKIRKSVYSNQSG